MLFCSGVTLYTIACFQIAVCACVCVCVCVCDLHSSGNTRFANNIGTRIVRLPHCSSVFVYSEYTYNMAAFSYAPFNDVIWPHVLSLLCSLSMKNDAVNDLGCICQFLSGVIVFWGRGETWV